MYSEPLDRFPLWSLFLGMVVLCGIALEAGYRIGRWRHHHYADERDQPVGAMVASILGLLALVLGFTFNLSASRFDARRETILQEANAIGTTYLRAKLLAEPQRTKICALLLEYADVRIRGANNRPLEAAIHRSEEIHQELWAQASEAVVQPTDSVVKGLFILSLNEMIDLHAKRIVIGLRNRIPFVIWAGLISLAVLGMTAMGYQAGLSTTLRSPMMFVLILAFVFVMYLSADLDRAAEGLLQVRQQALIDVWEMMRADTVSTSP